VQEQGGSSEVHLVGAWHAALNEGDVNRLVGLSHPDVEIRGPRGSVGAFSCCESGWTGRTSVSTPNACSDAGARWSWSRPGSGARRSRGR
jgi:hypothetical protein